MSSHLGVELTKKHEPNCLGKNYSDGINIMQLLSQNRFIFYTFYQGGVSDLDDAMSKLPYENKVLMDKMIIRAREQGIEIEFVLECHHVTKKPVLVAIVSDPETTN